VPKARVVTCGPIPILCYHKIGPAKDLGRRLNIETQRFETHVRFFARRGYSSLLGHEFAESWPQGPLARNGLGRAVCFTFDDGFEATLANATAALERHGFRGSFYAVTAKVGAVSDWDGGESLPLATWDTLRSAQAAGHEIGNHTVHHPRLAELDPEAQWQEIVTAQKRLVEEGLESGSFCYPYGSLPNHPEAALAKAGLKVGLSLTKGLAKPTDKLYALPRVTVAYSHSLPALLYRIFIRFRA
jgi:peptidoglycan/xylan/chitin deacetylase (PgdA/CDA1 family)